MRENVACSENSKPFGVVVSEAVFGEQSVRAKHRSITDSLATVKNLGFIPEEVTLE